MDGVLSRAASLLWASLSPDSVITSFCGVKNITYKYTQINLQPSLESLSPVSVMKTFCGVKIYYFTNIHK